MKLDHGQKAAFLVRAYHKALNSPDSSNQNGALLVNDVHDHLAEVSACNAFPPGVDFTKERATERPDKYRYFEHSERGAIYEAAYIGLTTYGATLFCPWAACCDCARAIICAGIETVVVHKDRMALTPDRWLEDVGAALEMLAEAGVGIEQLEGSIDAPPIRVNGVLWSPKELRFVEDATCNGLVRMDGSLPTLVELRESEDE